MPVPFFDSNIIIDWLNRRPEAKTEIERYPAHRISRIVWTEVLAGETPENRPSIMDVIAGFEIVELDATIAAAAADIRYRSRMKLFDCLILATAQIHGALLITRNTKDFPADMPGIRVPYNL